jgi:hypothetical protein
MQLIVADIVQTEAVRADAVVSCKAGDVVDMTTLCAGGEIAQLHVLQHALA